MSCSCLTVRAEDSLGTSSDDSQADSELFHPFAITLDVFGTTAFGGSVSWRFTDHFGARAGADFLEWSESDYGVQHLHYDARLRLFTAPLTVDFYPWKKHSFHVSLGLMINQNELTGDTHGASAVINGNEYFFDSVGTIHLKVTQQPVNPYLSIGGNFLYFDKAHHWALGGELGVAYTGDPKVTLTRSGRYAPVVDRELDIEKQEVQDYANRYQWWPIAKLTLSYSF